jgi:two-component system chemotaxis response regulator CheB
MDSGKGSEGGKSSVVAIGVSADGITALGTILAALPRDFPAPILIVQHRSPTGSGLLATVLGRRSALPVRDASTGETIRPGTVYLAPSGVHLVVDDGRVEIEQSSKVQFSRPSIDVLFGAVARIYGPHAIGVLLSGFGRDGVRGIHAIRAAGGRTVVQDPADARYPHMPQAAISADGIDLVLPLKEIAPALRKLVSGAVADGDEGRATVAE